MQSTVEINFLKARIFLVEDEALVMEDLKERLTHKGYEIVGTANSGHDAIEKIKQLRPDLIIMDIRISGDLNGIEVAIVIHSYFEQPVPIIFLTGFSSSTFSYLKVLPDYIYLNKPFDERVLFDAVKRALETSRQK